jgi:hypothetical protein
VIACIALDTLQTHNGVLTTACATALHKLKTYGYEVVLETDGITTSDHVAKRDKLKLFWCKVRPRGQVTPDITFDRRSAGWKGWRVAMVDVDEANRVAHDRRRMAKERLDS